MLRRNFGDPDEIPAKPFDRKLFQRLMAYVNPLRKTVALAGMFMLISTIGELAGPLILRYAIDGYIVPENIAGLWVVVALYSLLLLVNWISNYYENYLSTVVGQKAVYSIRQDLFKHLQKLSFTYFDRRKAGKIMSRFTNDLNALNQFLTTGILNVVSDVIILGGIIILMLAMSWKLALVTFCALPFVIFTAAGMRLKVVYAFRDTRNSIADVNSALQENISGVRTVQAFTREEINQTGFEKINLANLKANLKASTILAVFSPMVEMCSVFGTILVIWYGAKLSISGELTIGILAAFLGYVTKFFNPIRDISMVWSWLQSAMASSERLFEILDTEPEITEVPDSVEIEQVSGEVEFNEVSFCYDRETKVLDKVSFRVSPGEKVALVGPTGAGKTSIINLVARFYLPESGRLKIDGIDIAKLSFKTLRSSVGVVLQDTFIFAGTVYENIIFGRPEASQAEVEQVSRLTGAHEFIKSLPKGYHTQVMERGIKLSTGQRQLLACTRALLANPRILILDEATSSVDVTTELAVQRALKVVMEGRTCFIVAHRLSTVREADRIFVIDQGKIIEQGKHSELLANKGMYFNLYHNQFRDDDYEQAVMLR